MNNERWLLPEGIDEVLPPRAWVLENLRRDLLDLFRSWGYELVIPPFIEYLESLLTGAGSDLDLKTFKLTDQMTGRLMGVRADMTPQAARMDAHQLRRDVPTRLCYLGTVLHTRTDDLFGSRDPLQIGAELFGHSGVESDVEVLCLMMETLKRTGIEDVYLDLGHVGIFRGLARQAELDAMGEQALFDTLQRKAIPEIKTLLHELGVSEPLAGMLVALAGLNGDDAIERAKGLLAQANPDVHEALNYLDQVAQEVRQRLPNVPLHFDLGELRCYHYQTGVVFAAFVPGRGQEIARGGRYDATGKVFGRARPATGFSADLKTLLQLGAQVSQLNKDEGIFAPWSNDPALQQEIANLRAQGKRVICALPGQRGDAAGMGCGKMLKQQDGVWIISSI
ncbi:ATP phosphoribosyltransferase regulatory subunit [hydrothermal vent metagenome]|uniref:ATP phosphoribosyltransferase regulatory subunit n=1 Tax=hydrothermal vent metagenome TaxID=652676 RepID=A0A3B1ATP6_9ZZZZ